MGGAEGTEDNDSMNKNTGQETGNNGSNTPSTTAKQKKTFFNKKVSRLNIIYLNYLSFCQTLEFNIIWIGLK